MRVAFVSGNREVLPDAAIPLGLLYVMASTPQQHERILVDLCFEDRPVEVLTGRLRDFQPDVDLTAGASAFAIVSVISS